MNTHVTVVFPDYPDDVLPEPHYGGTRVMYLLHGTSGNAADWSHLTNVTYYAKRYNYIVIMPEVQLSFYTNMRYGLDYYSYAAEELPRKMNELFHLPQGREKTFIAGLSMGGYGAGKIGFRNPDMFGGVACFSALIDIVGQQRHILTAPELLPPQFDLRHWTGTFGDPMAVNPCEDDLFEIVKSVVSRADRPLFLQTCGTDDPLYPANLKFREHLNALGYGHTYLEWKDGHTWPFWDRSLELAMRFFAGETVSAEDDGAYDRRA